MGFFDRLDRLAAELVGVEPLPPGVREELELAQGFEERGERALAEQRLVALATQHPRVPAAWRALGELRRRGGNAEGAVDALGRAVDLDARDLRALVGLAEALLALKRDEPARDTFRRALAQVGDDGFEARIRKGRGRLALRAHELARAARELERAVELAPQDLEAAAELGRALDALGSPDGARWLLHAARGRPLDVSLALEAAAAQRGRRDVATELLHESAARLRAGSDPVGAARVDAARAVLLSDHAEALALARAAAAAAPGEADVARGWRRVATVAGAWEDAAQALAREAALGSEPGLAARVAVAACAEDHAGLLALAHTAPADDPLTPALRSFASGQPDEPAVATLAAAVPTAVGRRFLARSLAPPAPPSALDGLLRWTCELCARTPELASLTPLATKARDAFDRPLRLAIMGEFNAGKSSLLNALAGEEVAAVGATPTTATVNVLRYGEPGGRVVFHDGRVLRLPASGVVPFLVGLADDAAAAAAIREVEVFEPHALLRDLELVDTPGTNALEATHERAAKAFLADADAILWLFSADQPGKASELAVLRTAAEAGLPIVGVLNKTDRVDAEDRDTVVRHLARATSEIVSELFPVSARLALRAQPGDDGGLGALRARLERLAREAAPWKRRSALVALRRLLELALAPSASTALAPAPVDLARIEDAVRGVIADARLTLRGRLEAELRAAATEARALLPDRGLLAVAHNARAERFLSELVDEATARALAGLRRSLDEAARGGPPLSVATFTDSFRAHVRGLVAGGLGGRLADAVRENDPQHVADAFARAAPDPEAELLRPLTLAVDAVFREASARAARDADRAALAALIRDERLAHPLAALGAMVESLARAAAP